MSLTGLEARNKNREENVFFMKLARALPLLAFAAFVIFALLPTAQAVSICIPSCTPALKTQMSAAEEEKRPVIDFDKDFPGCGIGKIDAKYAEPIGSPPNNFDALIRKIVEEEKNDLVTPELVKAIMRAESNFNPEARSPTGARGLMQLTKNTEAYEKRMYRFPDSPEWTLDSVWCPNNNIRAGIMQIKQCISEGFTEFSDIGGCYYVGSTNYRKGTDPKIGPSINEHLRKLFAALQVSYA